MKVTITAMEDNLNAQVDSRFGRCKFFLTVDTDSMEFEVTANKYKDAIGGAGIKAAQTVANNDVDAVITGTVGPNAYQTLSAAGLKVYTGAHGNIKDVIEQFKKGELTDSHTSTVRHHFGMNGNK